MQRAAQLVGASVMNLIRNDRPGGKHDCRPYLQDGMYEGEWISRKIKIRNAHSRLGV
jgi:hypothetical protein